MLLNFTRDGEKKLYLDQTIALAQTFKKPMVQYGEGCRDLQWSDRIRQEHKKVSEEPLPETFDAIVRYYENIATQKRGSCTRSAANGWTCLLVIDDGKEFAISIEFNVDKNLNYLSDSMRCAYAG